MFGHVLAAIAGRFTIAENRSGSQGSLRRKKFLMIMLTMINNDRGQVACWVLPGMNPSSAVGTRSVTSRGALCTRPGLTGFGQQELDTRHPE